MARTDDVILVDADGVLISAVISEQGQVTVHSDDRALTEKVKQNALLGDQVEIVWGGPKFQATFDTPEGVVAAMFLTAPGRARLVQANDQLLQKLGFESEDEPGTVY